MRLRVEEGLAVADVHVRAAREVGHTEGVKVIAGEEDLAAGEVGFEEGGAAVVAVEVFAVVVGHAVWWGVVSGWCCLVGLLYEGLGTG